MLSREEVVFGYRFVLGREPENEEVIASHQRNHRTVAEFRKVLLGSPEFHVAAPSFLGALTFAGFNREDLSIFDEFGRVDVKPSPGFVTDFYGSRTRTSSLWDKAQHLDGKLLPKPVSGDYHGDVIEWLGLFKSVKAANGQFVAMELGAAYAPWLVAGAVAAQSKGVTDIRLTGIEGDPGRYAMMRQHFLDNGLARP